jgi:PAS domain S-box-containing protein
MLNFASREWLRRRVIALPVVVGLSMAALVVFGWQLVKGEQSRRLDAQTNGSAEHVVARLEAHLASRLAIGRHIRRQWASGGIINRQDFLDHANSAHELFRDFQAINWIDPQGIIRWVTPVKGNEAAQGLNIRKLDVPGRIMAEAERSGQLQVTPPIELAQTGNGFVAYIPLTRTGASDGFLNIVFRTEPLIWKAFPQGVGENYHMQIRDGEKLIFDTGNMKGDHHHQVQRQIRVGNRVWQVALMPTPQMVRAGASLFDEQLLGFGLLMTLATALLTRLVMVRQLSLRESEKRFKDFSESTSDWFWEMDDQLRFSYFSGRNQEITGHKSTIYVGKSRRELSAEMTTDEKWHRHLADLDNHVPFRDFRYPLIHADGRQLIVAISGKPVFDRAGNFSGYRGTGTDITAQSLAEQARDEAWREAEQANRAKSEFLATMSHEFRTPLNAILGFSEMMQAQIYGPLGSDKYLEYADDISHSGDHMLELVNDVLDIAAIEAGKRSFDKEDIVVGDLIQETSRTVQKAASDGGIDLVLEVPEDLPMLNADYRSATQIVLNLLSNSVKFTPREGTIVVSAASGPDELIIRVNDTGVGISPEMLPFITDPFSQTHTDPLVAQEGTGLGLSIVKSLIEAHDGSLNIESKVGVGTTVTVTFPI